MPQVVALSDDRVLEMRCAGHSYGAIATAVGLGRAREAYDAFHRALLRRPAAEQTELRDDELRRLDKLAGRLREQPGLNGDELARELAVLSRVRESLR